MSELSDNEQRELLKQNGWIVDDKSPLLGEGGGGRVFRVVHKDMLERVSTVLSNYKSSRERGFDLLRLINEVKSDERLVFGAAKVAKKPDFRMSREISVLRRIAHPNLIKLLGSDDADARWYVMPLMRRGTLKTSLHLKGDLGGVLRGTLQIASALSALHAGNIVHRDVKPGNVFLSDSGDWILGDLGIAFQDDDGEHTTTRPVSKDWFPRWYDDEFGHTCQVDNYMLGLTALFLLTGNKLLDPSHLKQDKFNLPKLFPEARGVVKVYEFISSLIVSDRAKMRYETASDLVDEASRVLALAEGGASQKIDDEPLLLRGEPRQLFSFSNETTSSETASSLDFVPVWIPSDSEHLVIWSSNSKKVNDYYFSLWHITDELELLAEVPILNKVPNNVKVPLGLRGKWCRLRVTARSVGTRMIRSFSVYSSQRPHLS